MRIPADRGILGRQPFIKAEEVKVIGCRAVKPKLGRFVDDELSPAEQSSVQAHIQECSGCREELNALRALSTTLDRLGVPPVPESLATDVISRVREPRAEPHWASGIFGFWRGWSAAMRAAACATAITACLIGLGLSSTTSCSAVRTESDMAWVGLACGTPISAAYLEASR